jgi:phenylpropionate dioxygenase-like ring-hydroxylating dioxygenase large terminal subunit
LPIPNGWFRVASSHELTPGGVRPLHYFGRDLVLFRTADGTPHVLDAHCTHLGAHLGHGGRVEDNALRCPFHGWLWDGQGRCLAVPYARKVPPKAQMRAWPVREVNGMLWVYYHAQGEAPHWEIPELPEYTSPDWLLCRSGHRWTIRAHPQLIVENGVDSAHIPVVHCRQVRAITSEALEVDGPSLVHRMSAAYHLPWVARLLGREATGPFEIAYHGLGCAVVRGCIQRQLEFRYLSMFFFTPIDEEHLEVHNVFMMKKVLTKAVTRVLATKASRNESKTFEQDIRIWENSMYCRDPILCDGDGPIMPYRRWARQFYAEPPARTTAQVAL